MAKSKITESHSLSFEGTLDVENMTVEVEEMGTIELARLIEKFNGCNVKVSLKLNNDIDEM